MSREQAEAIVWPHVVQMFPGQFVTLLEAERILGPERFKAITADPIRRWGIGANTVYPWNVADYVQVPYLRRPIVCDAYDRQKEEQERILAREKQC